MSATENYYQLLGLAPDATHEQIQSAYKRLSKAYHPDAGPTDSQKMVDINEAHDTLSDPIKRAAYDRILTPSGGGHFTNEEPPHSSWQEERARQPFRDSYADRRPAPPARSSRVGQFFKRRSKVLPALVMLTYLVGAQAARLFGPAPSGSKVSPSNGMASAVGFVVVLLLAMYLLLRDARAQKFDRWARSKISRAWSRVAHKVKDAR